MEHLKVAVSIFIVFVFLFSAFRKSRHCPKGFICEHNRCYKDCDVDRDCDSTNLKCVEGLCRLKNGCAENYDCIGKFEFCEDG